MALRNSTDRYGLVAQSFHWGIAGLILAQYPLGLYMHELPLSQEKVELYNLHKSLGVTIIVLVALRLIWRQVTPPPSLPEHMADWEVRAAQATHVLLYLFMIAQPLAGLVHGFATGFPTIIYGLFTLPNPIGAKQTLADLTKALHWWLAIALIVVVALHVGAALRHHFLIKDDVLRRMLPGA